jgi:hypothetical protein
MHKFWNNYSNNKHNINESIQRKKERCNLDYIEFCDNLDYTPHLIVFVFTIKIKSRPH